MFTTGRHLSLLVVTSLLTYLLVTLGGIYAKIYAAQDWLEHESDDGES